MTTGAFSQNIGKLFSELKLVTDNLLFNNGYDGGRGTWLNTMAVRLKLGRDVGVKYYNKGQSSPHSRGCHSSLHCLWRVPAETENQQKAKMVQFDSTINCEENIKIEVRRLQFCLTVKLYRTIPCVRMLWGRWRRASVEWETGWPSGKTPAAWSTVGGRR